MEANDQRRAERFLNLYRVLEGLLEKRYAGKRTSSGSVVMEYLHDADSLPCRADLDMCREIRNLLSHNADEDGQPVIEPSEAVVRLLDDIVEYVRRPRLAVECGTRRDDITFAHPNDSALDVARHMLRMGYSHVPVRDKTGFVGVFSASSLMRYTADVGFEALDDSLRVGDLKRYLEVRDDRDERYAFLGPDATLPAVRAAFEAPRERNHRLAAVFITEDGTQSTRILAMLTPWDIIKGGN